MNLNSLAKSTATALGLAVFTFCLTACPQSPRRVPILKSALDMSGTSSNSAAANADTKLNGLTSGDCLDLSNLNASLLGESDLSMTLNTDSVLIGSSSAQTNNGDFAPSNDKNFILKGLSMSESIPKLMNSYSNSVKVNWGQFNGLLDVQTQKNCDWVTFREADGRFATYTVVSKGQGTIGLYKTTTGESRTYSFKNDGRLFIESTIHKATTGCKNEALDVSIRQSYVLTYGNRLKTDGQSIDTVYLQLLAPYMTLPPALTSTSGTVHLSYSDYAMFADLVSKNDFASQSCK